MPKSRSTASAKALLVHRRGIVEPIEIRHSLQIRLVLNQLLGAAMQQSNMWIDAGDEFAIQLQYKPQNAVSGRMLRTEIDVEVADWRLRHEASSPAYDTAKIVQLCLAPRSHRQEVKIPFVFAYLSIKGRTAREETHALQSSRLPMFTSSRFSSRIDFRWATSLVSISLAAAHTSSK